MVKKNKKKNAILGCILQRGLVLFMLLTPVFSTCLDGQQMFE